MDTTKEYIEMCMAAMDIQKFRFDSAQWQDGDFAYTKGDEADGGEYYEGVRIIWNNKMANGGYHNWDDHWYLPDNCIWLPRQDQLQEILSKIYTLGYFISGLNAFFDPEALCPDVDGDYPACNKCQEAGKERRTSYKTMEQWWLAFVMSELYTKKWNGTDWVYDSSWRIPDHITEDAQASIANV